MHNRGAAAWANAEAAGLARTSRLWRPEFPRLLVHAVTGDGVRNYPRAIRRFLGFAKREDEKVDNVSDLDRAATWAKQRPASRVTSPYPDLKDELPISARALKNWEKLEGDPEREPLCRSLLAIAPAKLSGRNNDLGWRAWSQSKELLREQDIENPRVSDISVGEPAEEGGASPVSLELGVLERGEATKRGTSQGVVVLDPEVALFDICKKRSLRNDQRVFFFFH